MRPAQALGFETPGQLSELPGPRLTPANDLRLEGNRLELIGVEGSPVQKGGHVNVAVVQELHDISARPVIGDHIEQVECRAHGRAAAKALAPTDLEGDAIGSEHLNQGEIMAAVEGAQDHGDVLGAERVALIQEQILHAEGEFAHLGAEATGGGEEAEGGLRGRVGARFIAPLHAS